ncbi:MAG: ribulose-phosphate 3-epimerase, partial [Candidatus Eremiobacteraeota bacterium]|nr:ribulose-phosphate 3-epimerase [Candidatus Eremiobacteraeota bacterium]
NPGFSGQQFLESVVPKIGTIKAMTERVAHRVRVAVDGGVKPGNAGLARQAGADYLVAASAIFGSDDYAGAIRGLRG